MDTQAIYTIKATTPVWLLAARGAAVNMPTTLFRRYANDETRLVNALDALRWLVREPLTPMEIEEAIDAAGLTPEELRALFGPSGEEETAEEILMGTG